MNLPKLLHTIFTNFTLKLYVLGLMLVMALSVLITGYKLGDIPHGLTWDEAAIGYNGHAIFTTRRDEWLVKLPVSFRSFGDYKAPLAIYVNGVSTAIFGVTSLGIRLPFMVAGVLTVVGIMLLIELLWRGQKNSYLFSIFAGLLMVTTPWYVHYTRTGFESGLSLFLTVWAVYFFLLFKKYQTSLPIVFSILFFVLSLYTYHSSKIVSPLLFVLLVFWSKKEIFQRKVLIKLVSAGIGGAVLCYPLVQDALVGHGLERAGVTLFSQLNFSDAVLRSLQQFTMHVHPDFLLQGATTTLRHGDGQWGVLLLPTLVLILCTFLALIPKWRKHINMTALYLGLGWLLIGILPAAIAAEVPHSNRAFLALPGFLILGVAATDMISQKFSKEIVKRMLLGTVLMVQSIFFVAYIHDYFTVFASQSADDFKDGYVEAFQVARQYELGINDKPKVDKIIFSSSYGQPYIYALLVKKISPIAYQGGSLIKYEFRDVKIADFDRSNTLIITSVESLPQRLIPIHEVKGSNGVTKFKIYITPPTENEL